MIFFSLLLYEFAIDNLTALQSIKWSPKATHFLSRITELLSNIHYLVKIEWQWTINISIVNFKCKISINICSSAVYLFFE